MRFEIEEMEGRPELPPVAPKWLQNVMVIVAGIVWSVIVFNLA